MNLKTKFLIIFLIFLIVILLSIQFFKKSEQKITPVQPVLQQQIQPSSQPISGFTITSSTRGVIDVLEPVKLTFNVPIDLSSLKYQLIPETKVDLNLDPTGKELTITPTQAWIFSTKYRIIINGQIVNFTTIERTGI